MIPFRLARAGAQERLERSASASVTPNEAARVPMEAVITS
jgi:hypothetical protein